MRSLSASLLVILFCSVTRFIPVASADQLATGQHNWPGKASVWEEYSRHDFQVDGRNAFVVEPKIAAPGKPWVWRARFPGFHTNADQLLLARGFHVAHIDTNGMLGSPRAVNHWDAFYRFATQHGLNDKVAMEGVSRGGLFVYGFASRWPARVACIYCDTPVGDISSWPGGKGDGRGDTGTWKVALQEYGLTEESVVDFKGNPIDRLEPIAAAKIPVLHIVSLNDVIVPPTENTFLLAERYRKLGGKIDIIEVKEGTEKSAGHHFTHPDPVRVADFIERHTACLPGPDDYFVMRGSLDNCRVRFEKEKVGRVAFLGGSITQMQGWRNLVQAYLQQRFPQTKFDFVDAGIGSTGSTPGAFRLASQVLAKGPIDLLFEEASVNDSTNGRSAVEMIRGMEGIVRNARRSQPNMDVVVMHFVSPDHMAKFRAGDVPEVIRAHERVAEHYNVSTINLAREVTERIDAGQFDWKRDFKNLHPSQFGHQIYASTIRRLLSQAWEKPLRLDARVVPHSLPDSIDPFSYDRGQFVPLDSATSLKGFAIVDNCDPRDEGVGGSVRDGFSKVPMLVGTQPDAEFTLKFTGRGVGLFVAAGPDAGTIHYTVDGGEQQTLDLMTQWSGGLHIPWAYVLESELPVGDHELTVRIAKHRNERSKGHACRVVHLLVNGP